MATLVLSSVLVGMLFISAPAVLARAKHAAYTAGWVAAALVTVTCLVLPVDFTLRTLLALLVGPCAGLAVRCGRPRQGGLGVEALPAVGEWAFGLRPLVARGSLKSDDAQFQECSRFGKLSGLVFQHRGSNCVGDRPRTGWRCSRRRRGWWELPMPRREAAPSSVTGKMPMISASVPARSHHTAWRSRADDVGASR